MKWGYSAQILPCALPKRQLNPSRIMIRSVPHQIFPSMDPFSSNPSSKCITEPDLIIELDNQPVSQILYSNASNWCGAAWNVAWDGRWFVFRERWPECWLGGLHSKYQSAIWNTAMISSSWISGTKSKDLTAMIIV